VGEGCSLESRERFLGSSSGVYILPADSCKIYPQGPGPFWQSHYPYLLSGPRRDIQSLCSQSVSTVSEIKQKWQHTDGPDSVILRENVALQILLHRCELLRACDQPYAIEVQKVAWPMEGQDAYVGKKIGATQGI
jgi:hypothetical protein